MSDQMTSPLWVRVAALLSAFLLAVAGCGLPLDESPQAVSTDDIPAALLPGQLPTPTPQSAVDGDQIEVFMIGRDQRLAVVLRPIDPVQGMQAEAQAAIASLLLGTEPEERRDGITTAITSRGTQVSSVDVNQTFQLATLTLTPDSLSPDSREQKLAFAQMVFTLTAIEGIEKVLFLSNSPAAGPEDAVPLQVQTDTGLTLPGEQVARQDYGSIDPFGPVVSFDLPADPTPTTTTTPEDLGPSTVDVPIWVVNRDAQLVPLTRRVSRNYGEILQALLNGVLGQEQAQGLRSALTLDALVNSVEPVALRDENGQLRQTAIIDLAEGSLPPFEQSDEQTLAVGQLVFTMTGLIEIDQVLITIDGEDVPIQTQSGLTQPYDIENPRGLTRLDFSTFAPSTAVVDPAAVAAAEAQASLTPTPTSTPEP